MTRWRHICRGAGGGRRGRRSVRRGRVGVAPGAERGFGMHSASHRGRRAAHGGEQRRRLRRGWRRRRRSMERKLRPVWRRCAARELHPTLMAEGAEIRMQPVGDPATGGSPPWALRACCLLAAEMAVSMRARAPGERGTWRGRIPRSAQSCRNSGHLWREMRSAAGLQSP